jgi:F-type H+-transporting ATPase subunit delta
MNESIISVRYTKALFNLAKKNNILDVIKTDMELIYSTMNESKDLLLVFQNPTIKRSQKQEIINNIYPSINKVTYSFIGLLLKNRREEHLKDISRDFLEKYYKEKGIESAVLITSFPVDKTMLVKVKDVVKKALKTEVELSNKVNEDIIGGFIIRVGDKQFDASIKSNIERIKKKLLDTTVN